MRAILMMLMVVMGLATNGQTTRPAGLPVPYAPTGYYRIAWLKADSGQIAPYRDTLGWLPRFSGTIVMRPQDGSLYFYDSTALKWNRLLKVGDVANVSASDGLSKVGNTILWGQDSAQVGNPAILTSTREIPLNGNRIFWSGNGDFVMGAGNTGLFNRNILSIPRFAINDTSNRQLLTVGWDIYGGNGATHSDLRALASFAFRDTIKNNATQQGKRRSKVMDVRGYHYFPDAITDFNNDPEQNTNAAALFEQRWLIKDTLKSYNPGGDLFPSVAVRSYYMQHPGYSGRSVFSPEGAFVGPENDTYAALVVTNQINNNGGSSNVRVKGALSSFLSTLIATNGRDTIDHYISFHGGTAFIDNTMKIKKASAFFADVGGIIQVTDSIFGFNQKKIDGWGVRNYFGNTSILDDTLRLPNIINKTDTALFKPLSIDANGNVFKLAYWPSGSSAGGFNSNIGAGYRWAVPNTNNIKTVFGGFGIVLDSTSNANALTAKVDTVRYTGLPTYYSTDSSIKAIKECIWPDQKILGYLYNKSSWSDTTDFISHGNAFQTLSGDKIELKSTTTGSFGDYLTVGTPTMLQAWNMKVRFQLTAWGATSFGIGVGLHWANPVNQFDLLGTIGLTNAGTTALNIYKSNVVLQATGGTFTYTLNDVIELENDWNLNVMTLTARNITTGASAVVLTKTYVNPATGSAGNIPNTCSFAIYTFGGSTLLLQRVQIYSSVTQNPSFTILGDSKTQGFYANAWNTRYVDALNVAFPTTISRSGEGDRTVEVKAGLDEIYRLNGRKVIMNIGSNDYRSGRTTSQIVGTYDSIVNALQGVGYIVYHIVMPEDTVDAPGLAVGMTALKNYIAATYGANYIPAVWDTLADSDNRLKAIYDSGDGIHPNQAGNDITASVMINAGVLSVCSQRYAQFNAFNENLRVYGDSLAAIFTGSGSSSVTPPLNSVLLAGNSSSQIMNLTGVSSTSWKFSVGDFIVQPFSSDNMFAGANAYFNGTNTVRKSAGYASLFQFFNGQVLMATAGSSTAGSTATLTYPAKFDNNNGGTAVLGGNIASALGDYTGALMKVTSTQVGVGTTTPLSTTLMHLNQSQNAFTTLFVTNNNSNTAAGASIKASLNTASIIDSNINIQVFGRNYTPNGPLKGATTLIEGFGSNMIISQMNVSEPMQFTIGTLRTEAMRINTSREIQIGNSTDQGAYTLQNTGDFYQAGSVLQESTASTYTLSSTSALGSTSGGVFGGYAKSLPTGAGQRLAIYRGGSRNGAADDFVGASIEMVSNGAWTASTSYPSRITFNVTNASNTSPSEVMRIANNRVGVRTGATPTALFQIGAGGSGVNNGPLQFTISGATVLAVPEAGVVEPDANGRIFWTTAAGAGNREQFLYADSVGAIPTGMLFSGNGSHLTGKALGTATQQIRVNSGGTDWEWFTPPSQNFILQYTDTSTTTVANTTTESTLLGNGVGSLSINGTILTPGSTITLRGSGEISTAAVAGVPSFAFTVGSISVSSGAGLSAILGSLSGTYYEYEFQLTMFNSGGGQNYFYKYNIDVNNNGVLLRNASSGTGSSFTSGGTVTCNVTGDWSTAGPDNSIVSRINTVEVKIK